MTVKVGEMTIAATNSRMFYVLFCSDVETLVNVVKLRTVKLNPHGSISVIQCLNLFPKPEHITCTEAYKD